MTPITLLVRCCQFGLVSGELMYQLRVISVPVTYDVNHFVVKLPSGLVLGELLYRTKPDKSPAGDAETL